MNKYLFLLPIFCFCLCAGSNIKAIYNKYPDYNPNILKSDSVFIAKPIIIKSIQNEIKQSVLLSTNEETYNFIRETQNSMYAELLRVAKVRELSWKPLTGLENNLFNAVLSDGSSQYPFTPPPNIMESLISIGAKYVILIYDVSLTINNVYQSSFSNNIGEYSPSQMQLHCEIIDIKNANIMWDFELIESQNDQPLTMIDNTVDKLYTYLFTEK